MKVLSAFAVVALLTTSAWADILPRPNIYSARSVAKQYAKQRYGHQGTVSVAKTPLLKTGNVNPLMAYGVSVNGRQLPEAVMVRGGFAGYTASGIADVHYIATRGTQTKSLGTTMNDAVILRSRAKGAAITAVSNLSKIGEAKKGKTLSAAFTPNWPRTCGTPVPGQVQPQVFPGPASHVDTSALVSSNRGQTTVQKGFGRFVIMAQGNQ
jgi:hypothetical protein